MRKSAVRSSVDCQKANETFRKSRDAAARGEAMLNNPRNEESSLYANASQDQLHDHFGTGEGVNFGSAVRPPSLSLFLPSGDHAAVKCISASRFRSALLPPSLLPPSTTLVMTSFSDGKTERARKRVSEQRATEKGAPPPPSHKYRNTHSHSLRLPNSYRHL